MKISNCVFKDNNFSNDDYNLNNETHKFNKKYLILENNKQKAKLQKLVSLVLSKINSDSLNDLRTLLDDGERD